MSAPTPQREVEQVFNDLADVGYYDQQGLNAYKFRAMGLARKFPQDPTARASYAAILICTGHLQAGKDELAAATALLGIAPFPAKMLIATLLDFTCQFEQARAIYQNLLDTMGEDLRHPNFRILDANASTFAIVSGNVDFLRNYMEATHADAKIFHDLVTSLGLTKTLKTHQDAVNDVLGDCTAMVFLDQQYDPESEDDIEGIILKYFVPEDLFDGRALRRKVFQAVKKAEETIGKEPGYFASRIAVDILALPIVGQTIAA